MRLILIRHGDPDYARDALTEKGQREAKLLALRASNWKVDDIYVSPLGRARETAKFCLDKWNKSATVLDWAREFPYYVEEKEQYIWDFYPSQWTGEDSNFKENDWAKSPRFDCVGQAYRSVCASLDELLLGYGYERRGRAYRVKEHSDKTIVIFCHFGISMIFLSHLLNISAQTLLHGLFLAPTSVTVLNTEERAGDEAYFRAERIGDCYHLLAGNESVSPSGYFAEIMQEKV